MESLMPASCSCVDLECPMTPAIVTGTGAQHSQIFIFTILPCFGSVSRKFRVKTASLYTVLCSLHACQHARIRSCLIWSEFATCIISTSKMHVVQNFLHAVRSYTIYECSSRGASSWIPGDSKAIKIRPVECLEGQ